MIEETEALLALAERDDIPADAKLKLLPIIERGEDYMDLATYRRLQKLRTACSRDIKLALKVTPDMGS